MTGLQSKYCSGAPQRKATAKEHLEERAGKRKGLQVQLEENGGNRARYS